MKYINISFHDRGVEITLVKLQKKSVHQQKIYKRTLKLQNEHHFLLLSINIKQ